MLYKRKKNIKGKHGNGDVTKMENLKDFQAFVLEQTNYKGVHFVMADGVLFISICSNTGFQIHNLKT